MTIRLRPSQINCIIILLHISTFCYPLFLEIYRAKSFVFEITCPACNGKEFKYHAKYYKYFYAEQLLLIRVRCRCCGRTHALIPSFSLPGTSMGTVEAEDYLIRRQAGDSREKAFTELTAKGYHPSYAKKFERMLHTSISQAQALLPKCGDPYLHGLEWIRSIVDDHPHPLLALNDLCLRNGFNAVCCTRYTIHRFTDYKPGTISSHDSTRSGNMERRLDSS